MIEPGSSKYRFTATPDVKKLREDSSYQKILELDFKDMVPFVLENIRKRGAIPLLYAGVNAGILGFILFYAVFSIINSELTWSSLFKQMVAGIFTGSILVIPIHELLHGAAYRLLGAKKIRFGADMQQFIFYVTAHHYPVSGRQLNILAMTPFVIINLATLIITGYWLSDTLLLPAFFLLSHNVMCIGDFAIANYIKQQGPAKIYSFDDTDAMKSYFYKESV